MPPLRERPEDVLPLAEGILARARRRARPRAASVLGARARERLLRYPFPGNVRELRNVLERALVLEPGPELELGHLDGSPDRARTGAGGALRGDRRGDPDGRARAALRPLRARALGGRRMEAAKALGLSYPTFLKRIGED